MSMMADTVGCWNMNRYVSPSSAAAPAALRWSCCWGKSRICQSKGSDIAFWT